MADLTQKLRVLIEGDNKSGPAFDDVKRKADDALGNKQGGLSWLGVAAGNVMANLASNALGEVKEALLDVVSTGTDFEANLSRVGAIAGANTQQIQALKDKAIELGSSTIFTGSDVLEGMEKLAMAGFDVNEIVAAMPGLLETAAAAGSGIEGTADIISNIMSAFGISADNSGQIGDILTKAFTSSNTTLETLGATISYVGPIANTLGIDLSTVATAAGLMGDAGIQGERAGTALRQIFIALSSYDATKGGENAARISQALFDTDGRLKDLPELIETFRIELGKLDPQAQTLAMKELVGTEAMGGLAILLQAGPEKIEAFRDSLRDSYGTAAGVAKEQTDNLYGSFAAFTSNLEALKLKIFDGIQPALKFLLDEGLTPLVRTIAGFIAGPNGQGGRLNELQASTSFTAEKFSYWRDEVVGANTDLNNLAEDGIVEFESASQRVREETTSAAANVNQLRINVQGSDSALTALARQGAQRFVLASADVSGAAINVGTNLQNANAKMDNVLASNIALASQSPTTVTAIDDIGDSAADAAPKVNRLDQNTGSAANAAEAARKKFEEWRAQLEASTPTFDTWVGRFRPVVQEIDRSSLAADTAREAVEAFGAARITPITVADMVPTPQALTDGGYDMGDALSVSFGDRWRQRIADPQSSVGQFAVNEIAAGIRAFGEGASVNQVLTDAGGSIGFAIGNAAGGPIGGAIGTIIGEQVGSIVGDAVTTLGRSLGGLFGLSNGYVEKTAADLREIWAGVHAEEARFQEWLVTTREGQAVASAIAAEEVATREQHLEQLRMDYLAGYITLEQVASALGSNRGNAALFAADVGLSDADRSRLMDLIPAASGYSGLVSRPTMFLAGEAGPEQVDIIPLRGSQMGSQPGFAGASGNQFTFNLTVQAWDGRDVERYVNGQLRNQVLQIVQTASRRGVAVADDTGIRRVAAA